MSRHSHRTRLTPLIAARCAAVWAVASIVTLLAWLVVGPVATPILTPSARHDTFETLLVAVCALALLLAVTWLWVIATTTIVSAALGLASGRSRAQASVVRRVVLAACGLAVAATIATPALAQSDPEPRGLDGLRLPDRATSAPAVPSPRAPIVVKPGESLWGIAERTAKPGESIDQRWRAIWHANRDTIGEDPDLILPGQRLDLPPQENGELS